MSIAVSSKEKKKRNINNSFAKKIEAETKKEMQEGQVFPIGEAPMAPMMYAGQKGLSHPHHQPEHQQPEHQQPEHQQPEHQQPEHQHSEETEENKELGGDNEALNEIMEEPNLVLPILEFVMASGEKGFAVVAYSFFRILNVFLVRVKDEFDYLAGKEGSDEADKSVMLSKAILETSNNPEFQEKWKLFVQELVDFLKPLLSTVTILLQEETETFGDTAREVGAVVGKNMILGAADGIQGGLATIPGVGTGINALNVLQAVLDSTSTISIAVMQNSTMVMSSLVNLFGSEAGNAKGLINSFNDILSMASTGNDGMTDVAKKEIDQATKNVEEIGKAPAETAPTEPPTETPPTETAPTEPPAETAPAQHPAQTPMTLNNQPRQQTVGGSHKNRKLYRRNKQIKSKSQKNRK
jgi:hypothetical protein